MSGREEFFGNGPGDLLKDRIALITGAGRGIGKGIARQFARSGACVWLSGRTEGPLEETAKQIRAEGGKAQVVLCDVTKEDQVADMVRSVVEEEGRIDILVNNAGISREMPLLEMSIEIFDEIMTANMRSVMLVTKAVLPHMISQKYGRIINIGSGAALRGLPGSSAYSASKAAVLAFTQSLGDEIRAVERGIRINAICPGPVDTELFQKSERREYILAAGGDVSTVEEMGYAAVYLASDLSGVMNSQVLTLRGFNRW